MPFPLAANGFRLAIAEKLRVKDVAETATDVEEPDELDPAEPDDPLAEPEYPEPPPLQADASSPIAARAGTSLALLATDVLL